MGYKNWSTEAKFAGAGGGILVASKCLDIITDSLDEASGVKVFSTVSSVIEGPADAIGAVALIFGAIVWSYKNTN